MNCYLATCFQDNDANYQYFLRIRYVNTDMPISKRWSKMTISNIQKKTPRKSGIYELKNFGEHVYIGKASNLTERLLTHNRERDPNYFRYKKVGWLFGNRHKMEKQHLARFEDKKGRLPAWNQRRG